MAEAHEATEHAEHAAHAAHSNKGVALLIAVIALFLAFSETLGKSAQTEAIAANVEAANLWAFFQAKTIRMTAVRTAAEAAAATLPNAGDEAARAALKKQIDTWQKTAARYDDEPETNEGRKQLSLRAQAAEKKRDHEMSKYHNFELASAAFQIGIVLASASIITGMGALTVIAGLLALAGLVFTGIGVVAPDLPHDLLHLIMPAAGEHAAAH
jgi:hypothetical protein